MSRLEFFGTDEGHEEIAAEHEGDDEAEDGFHHGAEDLQPIAEHGIAGPEEEERQGERKEDDVEHETLHESRDVMGLLSRTPGLA